MVTTLTTSGAVLIKAGTGASSYFTAAATAEARIAPLINDAEAILSTLTRRDWVALSGATLVNFKEALDDVCSDMAAMRIISYDMSGYTSRYEATTMLDVLTNNIARCIKALEDSDKISGVVF